MQRLADLLERAHFTVAIETEAQLDDFPLLVVELVERGAHPLAKRVQRFARQLEGRFRLPVACVDERYTSVEAESLLRGTKKRKAVDSVAAQLILEQYFHGRAA